jgi:1,4-dihydroxy-6-naphthoate synthase
MMTQIRIAHSPDADDAFMFHALTSGKIEHPGLEISEVREDIETLNQKAKEGAYEVTAISFHAFPSIASQYYLLTTGACFGDRYGPIVVAAKALKPKQLLKVHMGIPGKLTTAFLALKLYEHFVAGEAKSGICYTQVPFDQIMNQVKEGKLDAGLIIHEGQLSFADSGLTKIVDLGEWWHKETDLPLPLGGIAVRRDVGTDVIKQVGDLLQKSIQNNLYLQ